MGDKMRQTRIDHIKMLTLYAVNHGLMDADPFTGFKFVKAKGRHSDKAKNKTKPFSPADIRTILPHCASNFHEDTLDYWAPIISAYTGARREEIGQLYVSDVTNWGNSLKIKLTDEGEDQKVKNQHSFRTIPVPPILLEAGFGEFVTRRRQAGGKMLFLEDYTNPDHSKVLREVQTTGRERFSETYGTRFGRKVKVPLKISGEGLTFHSFRHSWTDAARRAGISAEIRRLIAGRLDDEDAVESQYGGADLLREKLNAMIEVAPYLTLDAELPDDSQPDL
jgi:integrase